MLCHPPFHAAASATLGNGDVEPHGMPSAACNGVTGGGARLARSRPSRASGRSRGVPPYRGSPFLLVEARRRREKNVHNIHHDIGWSSVYGAGACPCNRCSGALAVRKPGTEYSAEPHIPDRDDR